MSKQATEHHHKAAEHDEHAARHHKEAAKAPSSFSRLVGLILRIPEILEIDRSDIVHVRAAGCAHEDCKKGEGKKNLVVIWPEYIIAEI